jgi:hypothetical protein
LNDLLLYAVAVVADPHFVIFTLQNKPGGGAQLFLHYLAGTDIVELSRTAEGRYALLLIPDRAALLDRIRQLIALDTLATATPPVRFTIAEQDFETIQDLAEKGQLAEAAAMLKHFGINGLNGESLLTALETTATNSLIVVVRPRNGQVTAGRKASLFRAAQVAWLAKRVDATTHDFSVETVQADTLPLVLDSYLEFLSTQSA